ncbi:hypothetical protein [Allomuricauda sp. NBRC 101325]|uniref:hypothetical protein n=1 Tax=Allomuricauda sp. NBRC 101325 TaxID=1113758 RepID=UPI0024A0EBB5|nr:hypothetical protein [Muricauda sp. NBRC 101325]GLU43361.1 hypothetical protein Musp01_09850 [Muricauda sp. NBRC 101325]
MKNRSVLTLCLVLILSGCINLNELNRETLKPTICIIGGTPSTEDILNLIPDSLKTNYNFISFNRPGFGGTENEKLTKAKLYELASKAGLKKSDFGVIGISGGAPYSILIANEFDLKHCGIISGMVSKEAFFQYDDKAITSGVMKTALGDYKDFKTTALQFPNIAEIVKQAGATSEEIAIRACFDDFNFILANHLYSGIDYKSFNVDWWHGEEDVNVPIESVELFLEDFPNSSLNKIHSASHNIDANIYISKIILEWTN